MTGYQHDLLRVQPHMISSLRAEFRTALEQLQVALVGLNQRGYLSSPWLGDEVSAAVAVHYTERAIEGPGSSYQALVAYRDELQQVHDTLQRMDDEYHRTDHDSATNLQRRS